MSLAIGEIAPAFELPDTEGEPRGPDGAAVTVVVFTCNHCPYALAWHERLLDVARDYASRGVATLLVNPNDPQRKPADGPDAMRERVAREGPWPAPYLFDATQQVARSYGARTTPDVFVLDRERRLRYRGAPDADHGDDGQRAAWLRAALDDVLAGEPVGLASTDPVGCSIKWREG